MRKRVQVIALLASGAAVGSAVALFLAYRYELKSGEAELMRYAHTVLAVAEQGASETNKSMLAVRDDHLPFCSDDELALMRRLVYNGVFLRDLGRSKDGFIHCTSALGRLTNPIPVVDPDLVVGNQKLKVFFGVTANRGVAIAPGLRGIIVDIPGVSAVVNQAMLPGIDDGPMHASGYAYDRAHGNVALIFGDPEPLSAAEVVGQRLVERDGGMYQPLCSRAYSVCVAVRGAKAEIIAQNTRFVAGETAAGALVGMLVVAIVSLCYYRQQSLERQLRRAVREHRIKCVYQPIVDLETGEIRGAETLARWTNDCGEAVSPEMFIAIAEEKGFVGEITTLVLGRAIDELGPVLYQPGFTLTVNIAASDLADPGFPGRVQQSMAWTGIPPSAIAFELTEHSTADRNLARNAIARLKAAGHAMYLDDFGTGYSSLSYLHDLQVDAIKIDRAFTATVGTEAVTAAVVPQILAMAKQLRLTVVVEGVETEEQGDYFRRAHPGILGQGWHYGRPVSAAEFMTMLGVNKVERQGVGSRE